MRAVFYLLDMVANMLALLPLDLLSQSVSMRRTELHGHLILIERC